MHIIENYAAKLLCKIDKPFILEKFYPIPEKYITLSISGAMPSKLYDFWSIITDFVSPVLARHGIQIIQLGDQNEPPLKNTIYFAGQTDIHQSAYIVKNSLLHVGTDSFLIHVASGFNIPIVALYSVSGPNSCGPYWGDKNRQILIEPNFPPGQTYSYNPNETPKIINTIKVEQIVSAIGKLLNIQFPTTQSVFTGARFNQVLIDVVPNVIVDPNFFKDQVLNLRLDQVDEITPEINQFVLHNTANRAVNIVTDKSFNVSQLAQFKQSIRGVVLDLSIWDDEEMILSLVKNHIKFVMICDGSEERLRQLKLKYCEWGVVQKFVRENEELANILQGDVSGLKMKTNRIVLSNSKIYLSFAAARAGREISGALDQEIDVLENYKDLTHEADFLYIYRQN